jgi:hypothetical protein
VASIPLDPQNSGASNGTGYKISKDATSGRTTVSAIGEQGKTISVTR